MGKQKHTPVCVRLGVTFTRTPPVSATRVAVQGEEGAVPVHRSQWPPPRLQSEEVSGEEGEAGPDSAGVTTRSPGAAAATSAVRDVATSGTQLPFMKIIVPCNLKLPSSTVFPQMAASFLSFLKVRLFAG